MLLFGGVTNVLLVLIDIPLCSAIRVDRWREVSPMYVDEQESGVEGFVVMDKHLCAPCDSRCRRHGGQVVEE